MHKRTRAAMSAGDAVAVVRWDFCRLDFFGTFLIKQKSTEENRFITAHLFDFYQQRLSHHTPHNSVFQNRVNLWL